MKTFHLFHRINICISIILLVGHLDAQDCLSMKTVNMAPWTGDMVVQGSDFIYSSHDSVKVSLDINGSFTSDLALDCEDVTNATGPKIVYVQAYDSGQVSICNSSLEYLDNISPVISSMQDVVLELDQNGIGKLTIADIDNGSYDICGPVTLEISQTDFNTSHIGINKIYLKATDLSGNYNQGWTNVLVKGYPILICDTLSRTSPITDCSLGHSDQDDVEWPADISISHDLIEPYDLIYYSNIDALDAQPSFYNSPHDYEASYQDSIVYSAPSTLILDRKWVAINSVESREWDYTQRITIDITGITPNKDVVSVFNVVNREMPGVLINGTETTDEKGEANVGGFVLNMEYNDERFNGVNILDLVELKDHIKGVKPFPIKEQRISGDLDNDDHTTQYDFQLLKTRLLFLNLSTWKFVEKQTASALLNISNGIYKGYKLGDVNGDATLIGEPEPIYEVLKLYIKDKLLNKGERYAIPIYAKETKSSLGIELRMNLKNIGIQKIDKKTNEFSYSLSANNVSTILDLQPFKVIQPNTPIYTFEIIVEENTLLSDAFTRAVDKSFFVDENYKLYEIELNVEETIPTGLENESIVTCKVYPNPASSQLFFNIPLQEFNISLFNASGVKVQSIQNQRQMDVSGLPSGTYTSVVSGHEQVFKQKVILIK